MDGTIGEKRQIKPKEIEAEKMSLYIIKKSYLVFLQQIIPFFDDFGKR